MCIFLMHKLLKVKLTYDQTDVTLPMLYSGQFNLTPMSAHIFGERKDHFESNVCLYCLICFICVCVKNIYISAQNMRVMC